MSWKTKAHVLALLSRLPAGKTLYHHLQKICGTNELDARRDLNRAFELVSLVHQAGGTIEQAACLEVGTGWRPFVPFVLALGGARSVMTVDVNPWMTAEYAWETWRALEYFLPEIAAACHLPEHEVWDRYHSVPRDGKTLQELLPILSIEYVYPGDARHTGLADQSTDLVLSSNTLEHVPPRMQRDIHQESLRILKEGGLIAHRFNPQDHYATVDPTITNSNFLRYSSRQWHWYGGSGLAYHNRLRSLDYREMLESIGFEIDVYRERVDKRSFQAISRGVLPVHADFERYTPEELAVDYVWLAARKPFARPLECRSTANVMSAATASF